MNTGDQVVTSTDPMRVNRTHTMIPAFLGVLLSIAPCGCGSDSPEPSRDGSVTGGADGASGLPDGGMFDGSAQSHGDAGSSGLNDASAAPPTQQTSLGSCEGELLMREYPVTVTVDGLSVADGTPVWGWVSFGADYDFCSVLGETKVQGNSFTLSVTATSHGGYFPDIAFWIDENRDRKCDPDQEIVFRSASNGDPRRLNLELSSDEIGDSFFNDDRDRACEPFDRFVQP